MNIAVLCATRRGALFLEKLFQLQPKANYYVFSFPETANEPPYCESICQLTKTQNASFYQTRNIADPSLYSLWENVGIDFLFAVSWRYMIPMDVACKIKNTPIVFHDSFLPEYRGFSPTVWAIINGEEKTGASVFYLDENVDAGDLIDQAPVPIGPKETIAEIMEKVTEKYLTLLEKNLSSIIDGTSPRWAQDQTKATYVSKRLPRDNEIDWKQTSCDIFNLIRATTYPYPGAFTWLRGKKLIIWSASIPVVKKRYVGAIPGAVAEIRQKKEVIILTGDGEICVHEVQLENEKKMPAINIINKYSVRLGV